MIDVTHLSVFVFFLLASWSSGKHSALGSEGPEFESCFHCNKVKNEYLVVGSESSCHMAATL